MPEFFIKQHENGKVQGPFSVEQIRQFISQNKVKSSGYFSIDGKKWDSATKLPVYLKEYPKVKTLKKRAVTKHPSPKRSIEASDHKKSNHKMYVICFGVFTLWIAYFVYDGFIQRDDSSIDMTKALSGKSHKEDLLHEISLPIPVDDEYHCGENWSINIDAKSGVLANDPKPNLSYYAVLSSQPNHGQLVLQADGSFLYHAEIGYVGEDQFKYKVHDGTVFGTEATVNISVGGPAGVLTVHTWRNWGNGTDFIREKILNEFIKMPIFPDSPNSTGFADELKIKTVFKGYHQWRSGNKAIDTVRRYMGYVHPPVSANYTFYMIGNHDPHFYLSSNDDPANKELKLNKSGVAPDGSTCTVYLEGGKRYYIEVLKKTDRESYFQMDWSSDSGLSKQVISAQYISPYVGKLKVNGDDYQVSADRPFQLEAPGVMNNDRLWGQCEAVVKLRTRPQKGNIHLNPDGSFIYTPNKGEFGKDSFTYVVDNGVFSGDAQVTLNIKKRPLIEDDLFKHLFAYLPFDGDLKDVCDHGIDGRGRKIDHVEGKFGEAAKLSRPQSVVEFDGHNIGRNWTVSMWLRRDKDVSGAGLMGCGAFKVFLEGKNSEISVKRYGTENSFGVLTPAKGKWTHLVLVGYSKRKGVANNIELFMDGVKVGKAPSDTFNLFKIGGAPNESSMNGLIDDVALWKRSLSEGEVAYIFAKGQAGMPLFGDSNHYPPTVKVDWFETYSSKPVTMDILANDHHAGGGNLSIELVTKPSHGSLKRNDDLTYSYTSQKDYKGMDSFKYKVNDGTYESGTVTVSIRVFMPKYDVVPSVKDLDVHILKDTHYESGRPGLFNALAEFRGNGLDLARVQSGKVYIESDPYKNRTMTVTRVTDVSHGVLKVLKNGSFSYQPAPGFVGEDQFTCHLKMDDKESEKVTVHLRVVDKNPNVVIEKWSSSDSSSGFIVASAEMAGYYLSANRSSNSVEIRDIRESLIHHITQEEIKALVPWMDFSGGNHGICSLAISPAGRLVYIGLCGNPSIPSFGPKDAILLYNTNLKKLQLYTRLDIANDISNSHFGMLHYCGKLYVGTENGVLVYDGGRNTEHVMHPLGRIPVPLSNDSTATAIIAMTLDLYDEKVYAATKDGVYRIDVATPYWIEEPGMIRYEADPPRILEQVYHGPVQDISFSRTYGAKSTNGLFIQERLDANASHLHFVDAKTLRKTDALKLQTYTHLSGDLTGLAATPCGRMLLAMDSPKLMSDSSDTRLDFEAWIVQYFKDRIKSKKEGLHHEKSILFGERNTVFPIQNNKEPASEYNLDKGELSLARFWWPLFHEVTGDPEIEEIVEDMLSYITGPNQVGRGSTGIPHLHYYRKGLKADKSAFDNNGNGKALYGIKGALKHFKDNKKIQSMARKFLHSFRRMAGMGSGLGHMDEEMEVWGSPGGYQYWDSEVSAISDFVAAQDPYWTPTYEKYLWKPDDIVDAPFPIDQGWENKYQYLTGDEKCIMPKGYYYGWAFNYVAQERFFTDSDWRREYYNHVYKYCAWADDNRNPYISIFNWGTAPNVYGWSHWIMPFSKAGVGVGDGFETILLGEIEQFCCLGDTWPAVGLYLAYREGQCKPMHKGIGFKNRTYSGVHGFGRYTRFFPNWTDRPADCVGIPAFAELIKPGSIMRSGILHQFHRKKTLTSTNDKGHVVLKFSELNRRHISVSEDGKSWRSYGFQYSPYTFVDGKKYVHYRVEDPEGMHLLGNADQPDNSDFEESSHDRDMSGWSQSGSPGVTFAVAGNEISGRRAGRIMTQSSTSAPFHGVLRKSIDVRLDFAGTRYIVRGDGFALKPRPQARGFLQVQWDNDENPDNGVLSTKRSEQIISVESLRTEFRIDIQKPTSTADYLHISFVVEGKAEEGTETCYLFDNLSLVRIGVDAGFVNDDFEMGTLDGWEKECEADMISLLSDPEKVLDGKYALKIRSSFGDLAKSSYLSKDFDISGDPAGTRYISKVMANSIHNKSTMLCISYSVYDSKKKQWQMVHKEGFAADDESHGEPHYVVVSKGFGMTKLKVRIMVKRDNDSHLSDEIILDGMEFIKENCWPVPLNCTFVPIEPKN